MGETERHEKRAAQDDLTTPPPAEAAEDLPPEHDRLAEIEEAAGRTLSDDLTREATRLTPPEDDQQPGQ